MTADPAAVRRLAQLLREQAGDIRAEADRLVELTAAAGWQGRAGEALQARVRDRGAALRRSAARHDDAAVALARHAAVVEERLALLLATQRRVGELLDAAGALAGGLPDLVERFVPPPPGDPGWLGVDVDALARALDGWAGSAA